MEPSTPFFVDSSPADPSVTSAASGFSVSSMPSRPVASCVWIVFW